ncbi:hypothetical protein [Priestia aryabhattai]
MGVYMSEIVKYGMEIKDIKENLFVMIQMLQRRSKIETQINKLNIEEYQKLMKYDLELVNIAADVTDHYPVIRIFLNATKPESEWWWHLDKVNSGDLKISL